MKIQHHNSVNQIENISSFSLDWNFTSPDRAPVWLERKHRMRGPYLPDYFSRELGLVPTHDPEENLRALAKRQEVLSGARVNWLGTYQHAAQVWSRGVEVSRG